MESSARKIRVAGPEIDRGLLDDVSKKRILKWLEKPQEFGVVREFKVSELRSDTTYQRTISERWVQALIRNFDPRLLSTITVGLRGGNQNLVDGQHRHYLAQVIGLKTLWGVGLQTSNIREEARLFVELNKNRRTPMGQQLFAAKLIAGDELAHVINDMVGKYKFKFRDPSIFSLNAAPDTITAINVLEKITRIGGETHLRNVLLALRKAWDGDSDSLGKLMIAAVGRFFEGHSVPPAEAGRSWSKLDAYSILERGRRYAHRRPDLSDLDGVVHVLEGLL